MLGARFPGEPDNQPLKSVERSCAARLRAASMAKEKKPKKEKGAKESKEWRKARSRWQALEDEIGKEFGSLVEDGYDVLELETLRWDYRYDKLVPYKLTKEQLEYFVAEADARAANLPAPPKPGETAAAAGGSQGAPAGSAADAQYQRRSEVDVELIEKYLEKRITREARNDFASAYKDAFGEDLVVPANLDLVDMSYSTREIAAADRAVKLSKAEILGIPEEGKPEEAKAPEPVVEAAPAVAKQSKALAFATAFRKGVPPGPGFGGKWASYNPFHLWIIPKKYCGSSVTRYYLFFAVNLVLTILLFIPRLIIWPIIFVYKLLRRFAAPKVSGKLAPKIRGFQERLAEKPKADADKAKAPAKSS